MRAYVRLSAFLSFNLTFWNDWTRRLVEPKLLIFYANELREKDLRCLVDDLSLQNSDMMQKPQHDISSAKVLTGFSKMTDPVFMTALRQVCRYIMYHWKKNHIFRCHYMYNKCNCYYRKNKWTRSRAANPTTKDRNRIE